jgi:predicted nucleic acid-binding Zn ribbon protein
VGDPIARFTRPVDFQEGLLTIAVTNSSLLTELQFFQQEILTKVNTHIGRLWVRKLRFVSE